MNWRPLGPAAAIISLIAVLAWSAPRSASPDIILITVDTLRADRLSCYGSKSVETPVIDSLARDGVLFEQALAQVPLTWPSHVAILTGTYPFYNGVRDFTGQPLSPAIQTLAESLKRNGYDTGAVVSAFVLDRSWGLARGFDFYYDTFPGETFLQKDIGLVDRKANLSVGQALSWLKRPRKRPFFLWLHLYDPHSPYDPPEPFRSLYRKHPYDGEVAYVDSQLGRLFGWLKRAGLYENSAIVFVSDHGESLGEHGESEHGFFVYDATVRVPLIIKPASRFRRVRRRISVPVETLSVAPTILQLAAKQDPIQRQFQGASLVDLMAAGKEEENRPAYSETFYPFSSFGWSPLRSVQDARYHYIEAPQPELYDVKADPQERHNLASREPSVAAALRKELLALANRYQPPHPQEKTSGPSAEAIEKLRSLGYVAYRSSAARSLPTSGLADPKAKLWEYQSILQATDAFRVGKFEKGQELLKNVQESDPKLYLIPFMLGEAASRQNDWAAAARHFNRSLELNPGFDQAMMGLARVLSFQGDTATAQKWLGRALAINQQNFRAWYELAAVQARHDRAAAVTSLKKALSIQPNFALALQQLGVLELEQGAYSEAAQKLEKSVLLGLKDPSTLNYLGIAYSHSNRLALAVKTYRRALAADPNFAQAHLNLAYAYQKLNQPDVAERERGVACRLDKRLCQYALPSQE